MKLLPLILLLTLSLFAQNESFSKSKKELRKIYADHQTTVYRVCSSADVASGRLAHLHAGVAYDLCYCWVNNVDYWTAHCLVFCKTAPARVLRAAPRRRHNR